MKSKTPIDSPKHVHELKKYVPRMEKICSEFEAFSNVVISSMNDPSAWRDANDALDKLHSIKLEMEALTDGRPHPLDFSFHYDVPSSLDGQTQNDLEELKDEYRKWAVCREQGFDEKALVGGMECDADDLIKLKEWIEQVLQWHKKNPHRKNKG